MSSRKARDKIVYNMEVKNMFVSAKSLTEALDPRFYLSC